MRSGRPCQDAVLAVALEETRVVAVSDGHGTCRRSDVGARIAVEVATECLSGFYAALSREERENLSTSLALMRAPTRRQIVQTWTERVLAHDLADPAPDGLRDYGATLLFGLATPEMLLLGQLGDGDVLIVDASGEVVRPMEPDSLVFGNETPSLCDDEAWNRVRLAIRPAPEGGCLVLLSTDGYANSYPTDGAFDAVAVDYLKMVVKHGMAAVDENLARILGHVSTVGSGDDVSLALMYFPKETGEQP